MPGDRERAADAAAPLRVDGATWAALARAADRAGLDLPAAIGMDQRRLTVQKDLPSGAARPDVIQPANRASGRPVTPG